MSDDIKYCRDCGSEINSRAEICPKCGCRQIGFSKTLEKEDRKVFCRECGSEINERAEICPKCGCRQQEKANDLAKAIPQEKVSEKSKLTAVLFCVFLGCFGIHRFYLGKTGSAIGMIFTFGGLGIWALVDLILILCDQFTDSEGKIVANWNC